MPWTTACWAGLSHLHPGCVDVMHIHYLDALADYEQVTAPGGVLELALRLKREGKARFLSLSGHNPRTALRAVKDGHLDVVMLAPGQGLGLRRMRRVRRPLPVSRRRHRPHAPGRGHL